MNAEWKISGGCWVGLLIGGLVVGGAAYAQTPTVSPVASGSFSALQTYRTETRTLAEQHQTLISEGATAQQIEAWRAQNAPQFEALQEMAQQLAVASVLKPRRMIRSVSIPPNASGTMTDSLTARATLANARAQLDNQQLQTLPPNPTQEQITSLMEQDRQIFQQQHSADLQLQAQRADALAAASESRPMPIPKAPVIPQNATPQMQAFIAARYALARDWAQVWNQYLTAAPAARKAALRQWRQQNAARFEQLSELAGASNNSTSNQEGISQ
jgi:hypothetical protein